MKTVAGFSTEVLPVRANAASQQILDSEVDCTLSFRLEPA